MDARERRAARTTRASPRMEAMSRPSSSVILVACPRVAPRGRGASGPPGLRPSRPGRAGRSRAPRPPEVLRNAAARRPATLPRGGPPGLDAAPSPGLLSRPQRPCRTRGNCGQQAPGRAGSPAGGPSRRRAQPGGSRRPGSARHAPRPLLQPVDPLSGPHSGPRPGAPPRRTLTVTATRTASIIGPSHMRHTNTNLPPPARPAAAAPHRPQRRRWRCGRACRESERRRCRPAAEASPRAQARGSVPMRRAAAAAATLVPARGRRRTFQSASPARRRSASSTPRPTPPTCAAAAARTVSPALCRSSPVRTSRKQTKRARQACVGSRFECGAVRVLCPGGRTADPRSSGRPPGSQGPRRCAEGTPLPRRGRQSAHIARGEVAARRAAALEPEPPI